MRHTAAPRLLIAGSTIRRWLLALVRHRPVYLTRVHPATAGPVQRSGDSGETDSLQGVEADGGAALRSSATVVLYGPSDRDVQRRPDRHVLRQIWAA